MDGGDSFPLELRYQIIIFLLSEQLLELYERV